MHIRRAEFSRIIPNDGKLYGEVKVWPVKETDPMLAWFAREEDGCLNLAKLIRKQEELDLDWYDNDLRQAFDDVTDSWFTEDQPGGGCDRTEFEREILDYGNVAAMLEERLWQSARELADAVPYSPFAREPADGGEDRGATV